MTNSLNLTFDYSQATNETSDENLANQYPEMILNLKTKLNQLNINDTTLPIQPNHFDQSYRNPTLHPLDHSDTQSTNSQIVKIKDYLIDDDVISNSSSESSEFTDSIYNYYHKVC